MVRTPGSGLLRRPGGTVSPRRETFSQGPAAAGARPGRSRRGAVADGSGLLDGLERSGLVGGGVELAVQAVVGAALVAQRQRRRRAQLDHLRRLVVAHGPKLHDRDLAAYRAARRPPGGRGRVPRDGGRLGCGAAPRRVLGPRRPPRGRTPHGAAAQASGAGSSTGVGLSLQSRPSLAQPLLPSVSVAAAPSSTISGVS